MTDARYAKLESLLRIILRMEARRDGISLSDIQDIAGIERRAAERMRDALLRALPQMEEGDQGPPKRWVLTSSVLSRALAPTLDDLTALHRAEVLLRREGDLPTADHMSALADRLQAAMSPLSRTRLAPDMEALLQADGVALRPGPRETLSEPVLSALRQAILAGVWIECDYLNAGSGKLSRSIELGPIALLMGSGRQYLLAYSDYVDDLRLFRLANLHRVDLLDTIFTPPENFDLSNWLSGSFGVWREEPMMVEWRFLPEAAPEARLWQFHPTQTVTDEPDGGLTVRFTAGGIEEMCDHLFRWGDRVRIIAPEALRVAWRDRIEAARQALRDQDASADSS